MSALNFRPASIDCRKSQSIPNTTNQEYGKGVTIFRLRLNHLVRIERKIYIEKDLALNQKNIGLNTDNPIFSWSK